MTKPRLTFGKNGYKAKEKLLLSFPEQTLTQTKAAVTLGFKTYGGRPTQSVSFHLFSPFPLKRHRAQPALFGCELCVGSTPTLVLCICHDV